MKKFYTYKITNKINEKLYFGKAHSPNVRWKRHISDSKFKQKNNKNSILHKAMKKYGVESFNFEIIDEFETEKLALIAETELIKKFNSKVPNGYNITNGGEGASGKIASLKTRQKISIAVKKLHSEGLYDLKNEKPISEETIDKIRNSTKTRGSLSNEIKLKIIKLFDSEKYTKNDIAELLDIRYESIVYVIRHVKKYGLPDPIAAGKKISATKKGVKASEKAKENIRLAKIGTKASEKTKAKMSEAHKGEKNHYYGIKHDETIQKKMRLKQRERYDKNSTIKSDPSILDEFSNEIKDKILIDYRACEISNKQIAKKYSIPNRKFIKLLNEIKKQNK